MYAAIVVTSNTYYVKPAADGTFSWENVPAGHYRVIAWHKVAGNFQTELDVPESGTMLDEISLVVENMLASRKIKANVTHRLLAQPVDR